MRAIKLTALALCISVQGCRDKPVNANCPGVLPGWTKPSDGMDPHGIHSTVTMAQDQVLWDGHPVSAAEFHRLLALAPRLSPIDHVLFDPTGARSCREAEQVRDEINRLADCQDRGLCGQGEAREFKRLRDAGHPWMVKIRLR